MKLTKENRKAFVLTAVVILLVIAAVVAVVVFGDANREGGTPMVGPSGDAALTPTHYIAIDVADYGTMTAELYGDAAPVTVQNFVKLVESGFYNGLTFHRVYTGFVIQGGCPLGNGYGGSDENIKGEFAQNGFDNPIKHERGVLSMARSAAGPDTASSQFFIMHQAAPSLDGGYAAFGRLLSGIEIVDAICKDTPVIDRNGNVAAENQPVITAVRLIEKP